MKAEEMRITMAEAMGIPVTYTGPYIEYSCGCTTFKARFGIHIDDQDMRRQKRTACPYCETPFPQKSYPNFPDYTTDERHAFQAVDWLRREKGLPMEFNNAMGKWCVMVMYTEIYVENQSLPFAICEAFCKACGIFVEGGE